MLGLGFAGGLLGVDYWPSTAVAAVAYSSRRDRICWPPFRPGGLRVDPPDARRHARHPPVPVLARRKRVIPPFLPRFCPALFISDILSLLLTLAEKERVMQIAEREAGAVTVLDLSGKITLGEGGTLLKDKLQASCIRARRTCCCNLAQVLRRQRGSRRARQRLHDRDARRRRPEARERDQEAAGFAVDYQAADGLRNVRLRRRSTAELQEVRHRSNRDQKIRKILSEMSFDLLIFCLSLAEDHDPVGVRPLRVVADAPAIGRLGELLSVDHDEQRLESRRRLRTAARLPRASPLPPRTSPTSNATWPPGRSTRASSLKHARSSPPASRSTLRCMEILTVDVSMPQNHPRSQLSPA